MAENETKVTYKAVADFLSFTRSVDRAKQKLQELRKEEAALNAETTAGEAKAAAARGKHVGVMTEQSKALEAMAQGMDKASAANNRNAASSKLAGNASREAASGAEEFARAVDRGAASAAKSERATSQFVKGAKGIKPTFREGTAELGRFQKMSQTATRQLGRLQTNLNKLRDWRPRLIPPFIALIPIIGSLLALVNPLVAGFGAIIPVAFGFASSLGTLAGAALGAAPALAGLLATVFALKTAFGGVGNAFKLFGKTPAGGGGGGGGGGAAPANKQIELTQTEKITRAQEEYRRSIQDVTFAEEDLDDARKDYIKRVKDLQKAVDRAAASQARAAANSRLAQENYANVLADPGSTKGEKMDAAAGVTDAANDYKDVVDENKDAARELAELKKTGINGDRQVIQAQRAVTDALNAQRDAQIALQNAIKGTSEAAGGGGGGGAGAIDQYNEALSKLSPSARRFVEALVAMKPEMDKLRKTVQESFFSQFIDDIELLRRLFPPVTSMLSNVAAAAGRVADKFLLMVTSDAWLNDIEEFGRLFSPILETLGDAFLSLLDGFRNLTIAVTPFLGRVADRFKKFSENLRDTLGAARADGSLAAYMDRVATSWDQWWTIIKNVGKTLMNYSSASSEFGQWLTDGLEGLTESWVKNSEDAEKEGSGYKKWLEDLKPLLTEVKGLFGDFFGYLHDEATDPENIKQFTKLVKILRDDIGPAIGRILDALSKSGVGESLLSAIGSILDAIADFLDNGGAEGFSAFFDTISGLAKAAGDFVSALPKPFVKFLTESFAVLAALTFVGLNLLIGNLIRLGASKGLMSLLTLLSGGKVKSLGDIFKGGGKAAEEAGSKKGGRSFLGSLGKAGKGAKAVEDVAKEAGPAARALKSLGGAARFLKGGGPVGVVAGVAGSLAGDAISGGAEKGAAGGTQRTTGNIVAGAATGAGIGATVGSVVPGVGTAAGAAVGGVVGGAAGFFESKPEDKQKFLDDIGNFFTTTVPNFIKGLGASIWSGLQSFGTWLSETWEGAVTWLQNLPNNIAFAIGALWGHLQNFGDWLLEVWNDAVDWVTNLPQLIADTVGEVFRFFQTLGEWWTDVAWPSVAKFFRELPQRARDTVGNLFRFFQTLGQWWTDVAWPSVVNFFRNLPQTVANTVGNIFGAIAGIGNWLSDQSQKIYEWAIALPGKVGNWVGNLFGNIGGWFDGLGDSFAAGNRSTRNKNSGGVIRRAAGGAVPGRGNGDTVPAMLTPGEFVVRKAIVNRIGLENFERLNSGLMSFGQLVQRAQQEAPSSSEFDPKSGVLGLNGGGLVPQLSGTSAARMAQVATQPTAVSNDYSMHFGDIIVQNPIAERASDSLPKAIRRGASMGSLRRDNSND